ncbi:hypothetical protein CS022_00565 [Veronia nyctiphanis]|uniref:Metal-dependent hydrolase n=1 Tax=Veronia nyctiphanis TaxID=1278244 RepID=A0A4Q0Z009_9GAMM|nr:metal-dependent hydrolase [Veronia nyctiphanis]RXJ74759.1 hypothetical protein CS022_00565 [Veronia nyctiphanis]
MKSQIDSGDTLIVRHMDFNLNKSVPKYMIKDSCMLSSMLYFLSSIFPPGEAYFIRSVQAFYDDLTDDSLKEQVKAFISQEVQHGKQHRNINSIIEKNTGFKTSKVSKRTEWGTRLQTKRKSKASNLATTVALEHFTAILGAHFLRNDALRQNMHPDMLNIMTWHAIEEIEHKSVAFEVYQATVKKPGLLKWSATVATVQLLLHGAFTSLFHTAKEGRLFSFNEWKTTWRFVIGRDGVLRQIWPDFIRIYKAGFTPEEVDDSELKQQWQEHVNAHVRKRRVKDNTTNTFEG